MDAHGVGIARTLDVLLGKARCPRELQGWFKRTWQQARRFVRLAGEVHKPHRYGIEVSPEDVTGVLVASAYPDRVARLRPGGDPGQYQLSNGRSAVLPDQDELAGNPWLAVAELGGHVGESADRIYRADALNPAYFEDILANLVREEEQVHWDYHREQFVAERRRLLGSLQLSSTPLEVVPEAARTEALLGVVRKKGLDILPWDKGLLEWRARVMLMRRAQPEHPWPDLSDDALLQGLEHWLGPWLSDVRRLQDFHGLDLKGILAAQLPWPLPLELERLAPERLPVPSGSSIAIDYSQDPPVLAVKLQEMFGCEETPRIADGSVPLLVHLLSPAGRPLQMTQDLAGFWRSGYQEVRKEMRGRYPKHPWPEDPLQAVPTRHTNKRARAM
jgi:ATP-dependent helicase HrpB